MEEWAALETAPWLGVRLDRDTVLDRLHDAATRDPSLTILRVAEGAVTVVRAHAAADPEGSVGFLARREALARAALETAAAAHRIDCDVVLGLHLGDNSPRERRAPIFCFHKQRYTSGLLLPDLDFTIYDHYRADEFRDELPFPDKAPTAFFVGATTGGTVTQERIASDDHPRIRAACAFRDAPGVTFEISDIVQCDGEETRRAVERLVPVAPRRRVWAEQFAHRYLLSMDGNGATWSRLAVGLQSQCAVVRYASPSLLFYYHGLQPWVHYIPVRRDEEVLELVGGADRTAERDARIAAEGQAFARRHLNAESVTAYTAALIRCYAAAIGG